MMIIQHSVNSDRLLNTQSTVLQADWIISEINEKVNLSLNMPYWSIQIGIGCSWNVHHFLYYHIPRGWTLKIMALG